MKNKHEKALQMLEQALSYIPGDNALGTARSYVSRAIEEISRVENKRERRVQQQVQEQPPQGEVRTHQWDVAPMTDGQRKLMVGYIDQLIDEEKRKLESLKNKNSGSDLVLG